jgi:hypothetical protein
MAVLLKGYDVKIDARLLIPAFAIATALYFSRNEAPPLYALDVVAFVVIGMMLWWFTRPSRADAFDDARGHQQARESFALRLGKALNRVRRRIHG